MLATNQGDVECQVSLVLVFKMVEQCLGSGGVQVGGFPTSPLGLMSLVVILAPTPQVDTPEQSISVADAPYGLLPAQNS